MGLRDIESTLPPGFRFYPSDEELVFHYLYNKVTNETVSQGTLVEVDLHTSEPWELPDAAKLNANEWYFFSFRDRKYSTGFRTNRATKSGYWKATGKDRTVHEPSTQVLFGMRKTLVFYRGRAPNGLKTGWVMHEFRLENPHIPPKEDWVLCRVFRKTKGDTMRYGVENEQDNNIVGSSSLNMASSFPSPCVDQGIADGYEQPPAHNAPHAPNRHSRQGTTCSSSGFLNLAVWHYGFLDLTQETNNSPPVCGDGSEDYRFLLNMQEFEDYDICGHEQPVRNEHVP